jgi:transcriptional regulator with XRE-family HTH domain
VPASNPFSNTYRKEATMIFENIQRIAQEKNLTIQSIEKGCGLSGGIISKWKESNNPKIDNLKKVADFLGVTIEQLIAK